MSNFKSEHDANVALAQNNRAPWTQAAPGRHPKHIDSFLVGTLAIAGSSIAICAGIIISWMV